MDRVVGTEIPLRRSCSARVLLPVVLLFVRGVRITDVVVDRGAAACRQAVAIDHAYLLLSKLCFDFLAAVAGRLNRGLNLVLARAGLAALVANLVILAAGDL